MKNKNKALRLASCLLIAVLLTTCAVSGTFAKYVTGTTGTDKARVAYWGFDQKASLDFKLFDYTDTNVVSANDDKVIAPGTKASTTFSFGYTDNTAKSITAPEVAYELTVEVDKHNSVTTELDNNSSFTWTLQKGNETAQTFQKLDDLIAAIKLLSGDASGKKKYEAGKLPDAFTSADEIYTIGWEWAFGTGANDTADTTLGNMADLENIELTITITATQVD